MKKGCAMSRTVLLTLVVLLAFGTACSRLIRPQRSPEPTGKQAVTAPAPAAMPDLASMTFAERNDLFLQLLAARQAEGADTAAAEDAYTRSVEAALEGNSAESDRYLEQAISILWK
jgi:hypothetical protein